jgi:hypothetical protein
VSLCHSTGDILWMPCAVILINYCPHLMRSAPPDSDLHMGDALPNGAKAPTTGPQPRRQFPPHPREPACAPCWTCRAPETESA